MRKMPSMSSRELVRLLEKGGAVFVRQDPTDHAIILSVKSSFFLQRNYLFNSKIKNHIAKLHSKIQNCLFPEGQISWQIDKSLIWFRRFYRQKCQCQIAGSCLYKPAEER